MISNVYDYESVIDKLIDYNDLNGQTLSSATLFFGEPIAGDYKSSYPMLQTDLFQPGMVALMGWKNGTPKLIYMSGGTIILGWSTSTDICPLRPTFTINGRTLAVNPMLAPNTVISFSPNQLNELQRIADKNWLPPLKPSCECGAHAVNQLWHSDYCPLYEGRKR